MSEPTSRIMDDGSISHVPHALAAIQSDTPAIGFQLASEPTTGSLLRALAASKPGGRFLELGTGTGVGTAWLLAGMDRHSRLVSVDTDPEVQNIANGISARTRESPFI
jgi:predicted O-methyltransferase YrrM